MKDNWKRTGKEVKVDLELESDFTRTGRKLELMRNEKKNLEVDWK